MWVDSAKRIATSSSNRNVEAFQPKWVDQINWRTFDIGIQIDVAFRRIPLYPRSESGLVGAVADSEEFRGIVVSIARVECFPVVVGAGSAGECWGPEGG